VITLRFYSLEVPFRKWINRITFAPRVLILAYHRIADLDSDPQLLSVTPQNFAQHLEQLQENYNLISLSDLGHALATKKLPKRAVVLTLDDGYADNLLNAKPLLEKNNIPATVFVTTGATGQENEFWWDELERLLLRSKHLPSQLSLEIGGNFREWNLTEESALGSEERNENGKCLKESIRCNPQWNVTMKSELSMQQKLYLDMHRIIRGLSWEDQQKILKILRNWSGNSAKGDQNNRPLTIRELNGLTSNGLIEVGSHTVTHPVLPTQPLDVQESEIFESKKFLEAIGLEVNSFSYPYGCLEDHTKEYVKKAGYKYACALFQRPVNRQSDIYSLPRYLVRNWDGNEFTHELKNWL
jgi:peptidoglycan/xylan/chitin deacetylase (PgdA/CDA1 family)